MLEKTTGLKPALTPEAGQPGGTIIRQQIVYQEYLLPGIDLDVFDLRLLDEISFECGHDYIKQELKRIKNRYRQYCKEKGHYKKGGITAFDVRNDIILLDQLSDVFKPLI